MAAFQRALATKANDAAALSELSWALLAAGDASGALDAAERASSTSVDAKLRAASLYNAGRAAEALGDLSRAKAHLQASLELRDSEAVRTRLTALTIPSARQALRVQLLSVCQELPSAAAVCNCLAKHAGGGATCEVTASSGKRGQVVTVRASSDDNESLVPGSDLVLVAQLGRTWSALLSMARSDTVDLTERPKASEGVSVSKLEELATHGGTLLWTQTAHELSEWSVGELDESGLATLSLCSIPDDDPPACLTLPVAEWDYTSSSDPDSEQVRCEVRKAKQYSISVSGDGSLNVVLRDGIDDLGLVGRHRL